jgi:hypothetical protein
MASAMATSTLRWATGLLTARMVPAVAERLSSAVGLLADRLGWALYDAGHSAKASDLLSFALDTAARGADRDLRAHIMLDLSTVVTDGGSARDGVEILRLALGDERISAAERANLHAVCARHCGTAGDRQTGLRHVGLAEEALGRTDTASAPEWARRITVSKGHHDSALGPYRPTLPHPDGRAQPPGRCSRGGRRTGPARGARRGRRPLPAGRQ